MDHSEPGTRHGDGSEKTGFDPAFPFNAFLVLCVLTAAIAFASVTSLRASEAQASAHAGGPTRPLTVTSVEMVQGGTDGTDAWVAATASTLVAAFQGSANWHPDSRDCLPDVAGTVDEAGSAQWLGQAVGHVGAMAGDTSSAYAFTTGLGDYCQPAARRSSDGGATWTDAPLPTGLSSDPAWLRFDPARAGALLAAGQGRLSVSQDAGLSWTDAPLTVRPLDFDPAGTLYGWSPGSLYTSSDDGATWQLSGEGPQAPPVAAAGIQGGLLIAEGDGTWWYPAGDSPVLVDGETVLAAAAAGDGAVVAGRDAAGHPWLGAFSPEGASGPALRRAALPPQLSTMVVTEARVAANDGGAVAAFVGGSSVIAFSAFAR